MEINNAGRSVVHISRGDKRPPVFWMLMPNEKMYVETVGGENPVDPFSPKSDVKIEKVFVAKENVAGRPTNKFKMTWRDKEGNKRISFAWEAIDLNNAPIRQEFFREGEHVLVQLTNIQVQKLDPALFEVPSDYKKITAPPDAPKGPASPPAPKTPGQPRLPPAYRPTGVSVMSATLRRLPSDNHHAGPRRRLPVP
ncbi:MAG: hypothetical protein MPW15_16750 [Candidatus Manganitrophus sp.]|nr:hypothetical protein [Candidatus Manganitrophus sp.]